MNYKEAAKNFIENEKQFHLGVIPTEQSNPLTKNLSATIAKDTAAGVAMILSADVNIPKVAAKTFKAPKLIKIKVSTVIKLKNFFCINNSSLSAYNYRYKNFCNLKLKYLFISLHKYYT